MLIGIGARMLSLIVVLVGWDISKHSGWKFIFGLVIFIVGVEMFDAACIWAHGRREMPYRWNCPICRKRKVPTGIRASNKQVVDELRADHNRTVHLMEP